MKILQINAVYNMGSTGRNVKETAEYIKAQGIESRIATSAGATNDEEVYVVGNWLDKKMHALCSRFFGLQAYFSKQSTKKLIKWIKKQRPDVVHLHNLHANYIYLNELLKYLAKADIPTVITLHDCWFFTGKCSHYTVENCYKWETGCYNCPKLKEDHNSWFFDKTKTMWRDKVKYFQAIPRLSVVGVSDWITNEARRAPMFKNATSISRIYNWVDLEIFKPRETDIVKRYDLPDHKFLILCISAGWDEGSIRFKNLMEFAMALSDSMHIVLVGGIKDSINLPQNITSIGYISSLAELAEIYSNVNVYVHLSYEDTFGKVIAEALACGTPAVVYNSTACPELIANGCGVVVSPGNIEEIVDGLNMIQLQGKYYYQKTCRLQAEKLFSLQKNCAEYLKTYKETQKE